MNTKNQIVRISSILLCAGLFSVFTQAAEPPLQPASGIGGSNYTHSYIKSTHGSGDLQYTLYEPSSPATASAPVMLYLHGWAAEKTVAYDKYLVHLARQGNIVVFPKYGGLFNISSYEKNAKTAYENALIKLQSSGHVTPDLNETIFLGHSLGTQIAVRMADTAADYSYPAPRGLILHEPAGADQLRDNFAIDNNLKNIDANTLLTILVREDWHLDPGGYPVPVTIWHATNHLLHRNFLEIKGDSYGVPVLISDHNSVQTGKGNWWDSDRTVDAVDWFGYWRTTDAAIQYSLHGTHAEYVLGSGNDVTFMGVWSDATPVKPKKVVSSDFIEAIYSDL